MAKSNDANPRLIANLNDEPKQMLQPISGYEDEPLLSLEEACRPLEKIIDKELQQNMIIAKLNSTKPENGLTPDESASIHLYTMEWKIPENSLYAVLNRTLRLVDRRNLKPWFRYLKLFLTAFYKLPLSEHRTVWRGVPKDLSSFYPKGAEIAWWSVSSCTTSVSVLESPHYIGTSGSRTMFSIEIHSGKSIRSHSYFQQEDEILLPPGIYLKVVDKFSPAEGLHFVHLREISPPYKMLTDPFDLNQLKQVLPQPQPLIKQENILTITTITEPPSTSKNVSTTADTSESFVKVSLEKEELQSIVANNDSPFGKRVLYCRGRVCAKCDLCRDWYWRPGYVYGRYYLKRPDATCTYLLYGYYHYYGDYNYPLCACDDNCS